MPSLCNLGGTMPPDPVESMLQTMLTSFFNPVQQSIIVCSRCSKNKRTQDQQSSPTACKCGSNRSGRKHKRRSRKLKKSCLKTIVCVAKMAKNRGECQDCDCHGCGENPTNEADDERFCSKCGQLLPGENPLLENPFQSPPPLFPSIHVPSTDSPELEECRNQLELCRQKCYETKNVEPSAAKTAVDTGVQVDVGREEPVNVRIKVCPCPNGAKFHGDLNQSKSEPDMSKTNITYDDYDTSDMPHSSGSKTQYEYDHNALSRSHLLDSVRLKDKSNWRTNIAIMKGLALKMAKIRMAQDVANASRMLQQQKDSLSGLSDESEGELSEELENSRKTVESERGPRISRHAYSTLEDQPAAQPPGDKTRMSRATAIPRPSVYNVPPKNPDVWEESLGTVHSNQHLIPEQNTKSAGCCNGTGVYFFSPQNPSLYGGHCENKCSCSNSAPFEPHQPFPGPPYVCSQIQQQPDQTFVHCNRCGMRGTPHSSSARSSAWPGCH